MCLYYYETEYIYVHALSICLVKLSVFFNIYRIIIIAIIIQCNAPGPILRIYGGGRAVVC